MAKSRKLERKAARLAALYGRPVDEIAKKLARREARRRKEEV